MDGVLIQSFLNFMVLPFDFAQGTEQGLLRRVTERSRSRVEAYK